MPDIVDRRVVVLAPEKRYRIKSFSLAKDISRCDLTLTLRDHPMLDADLFSGVRIRPTGDIACGKDTGNASFKVLIDHNATIHLQPSLLCECHRRTHANSRYNKIGL